MGFLVKAGVRYNEGSGVFEFDFSRDRRGDVIGLAEVTLRESSVFEHTYLYGYEFCGDVPSGVRGEFIRQMKGLSAVKMDKVMLESFLTLPVRELGNRELQKVDCVVYPGSKRSRINYVILDYISDFAITNNYVKFELLKRERSEIFFDFDLFERHFRGSVSEVKYQNLVRKAEILIEKINSDDGYFSLAESVKRPLFRKYIRGYLGFKDSDIERAARCMEGKGVLLVDDVNTSGATLREALRVINKVAVPSKIIVFTILGKDYGGIL